MTTEIQRRPGVALRPTDKLKAILATGSVQEQFRNALGEAAPLFAASLLDLYGSPGKLQECDPTDVVREALKAAVLRLPLAKGLGFAWVVPRREKGVWKPGFQIGWKGWVQLAMRSGQYKAINAGPVFAGETVNEERLSGEVRLTGDPTSGEVTGFFAFFRLLNGFEKAEYWPIAKVEAHRDRYVPQWNRPGGAWVTHPREQATKTVLSALLRRYGVLSVEMQQAISVDAEPLAPDADDFGPAAEPETIEVATPKQAQVAAPTPPPQEADRPAWLELLLERLDAYREAHGGDYPPEWPEEFEDEATGSKWIAWFDNQGSGPGF